MFAARIAGDCEGARMTKAKKGRTERRTPLRVWAGVMFAHLGEGQQQVRAIIAATSERNIARRLLLDLLTFRAYWSETSNATFNSIAMARPGKFFARPLMSTSADDFKEVKAKGLR